MWVGMVRNGEEKVTGWALEPVFPSAVQGSLGWPSTGLGTRSIGSENLSFCFGDPEENPIFLFEPNGLPMRSFSHASLGPDVAERLWRDSVTCAYLKYFFLTSEVQNYLKWLMILSDTYPTGTLRISIYFISPSKKNFSN